MHEQALELLFHEVTLSAGRDSLHCFGNPASFCVTSYARDINVMAKKLMLQGFTAPSKMGFSELES